MEHKVHDQTIEQTFSDPNAAALARAACDGQAETIAKLVRSGINIDDQDKNFVTPLMWAVNCESLVGIEALLRAGANPNLRTHNSSETAVLAASTYRNAAILKLILKYGGDPNDRYAIGHGVDTAFSNALHRGIWENNWEHYYNLLDAGLDLNRADSQGETPVVLANNLNQLERVAEMLERGYHYNLNYLGYSVYDRTDLTPRFEAAREKVITLLRMRGVKFPVKPVPYPETEEEARKFGPH